jgi:hypothetical protein
MTAPDGRFLANDSLPLRGIKVVELSHMIMGPVTGMILADLGAEVIKIEPIEGDNTRRLKGSGIGYFPVFSRNKQSLAVDLKSPDGQALVRDLAGRADMLVENFRDDSLAQYGLDYAALSSVNPGLIYISLKGFLSGPYRSRCAGRSGPDDGRHGADQWRRPDPPPGRAFGQRHPGRHLRRGRRAGSLERSPAHRPWPAHPFGSVRDQSAAGGAVHRAVPADRHAGHSGRAHPLAALGVYDIFETAGASSSRW